jgi:hypothetical protein
MNTCQKFDRNCLEKLDFVGVGKAFLPRTRNAALKKDEVGGLIKNEELKIKNGEES